MIVSLSSSLVYFTIVLVALSGMPSKIYVAYFFMRKMSSEASHKALAMEKKFEVGDKLLGLLVFVFCHSISTFKKSKHLPSQVSIFHPSGRRAFSAERQLEFQLFDGYSLGQNPGWLGWGPVGLSSAFTLGSLEASTKRRG